MYQDGEEIELTSPYNDGVYEVTVDFAQVLKKWQEDNPSAGTAGQAGDADTGGTDTGDSGSPSGTANE